MKVAIAKVFRMTKSELRHECINLISVVGNNLHGDEDFVLERLADHIGEDLALIYPRTLNADEKEMIELENSLTDEDIRIILKHFGGYLIASKLRDFSLSAIVDAFDDCEEESFVQFLR